MSPKAEGVDVFPSLQEALFHTHPKEEIIIIGGESLYQETLPYADYLYRTIVEAYEPVDTFFPEVDEKNWVLQTERFVAQDLDNQYAYRADRVPDSTVSQMVTQALPGKVLESHQLIAGGCANLNYKVHVSGGDEPFLLRIYVREASAACREQKISTLLRDHLSIPQTFFVGEVADFTFSLVEFRQGKSLRDLLLEEGDAVDIAKIMDHVGRCLSELSSITFSRAGFFDADLNVKTAVSRDQYLAFAKSCLEDKKVLSTLGEEICRKIKCIFDQYGHLVPDTEEHHMVHGDFDPANILMDQREGEWCVSAILDWEFAFSGSVLFDVANMLRDAHHMPIE
ncbi:Dihydrofolate reductase type 3, partial [Stylophora pistillata]